MPSNFVQNLDTVSPSVPINQKTYDTSIADAAEGISNALGDYSKLKGEQEAQQELGNFNDQLSSIEDRHQAALDTIAQQKADIEAIIPTLSPTDTASMVKFNAELNRLRLLEEQTGRSQASARTALMRGWMRELPHLSEDFIKLGKGYMEFASSAQAYRKSFSSDDPFVVAQAEIMKVAYKTGLTPAWLTASYQREQELNLQENNVKMLAANVSLRRPELVIDIERRIMGTYHTAILSALATYNKDNDEAAYKKNIGFLREQAQMALSNYVTEFSGVQFDEKGDQIRTGGTPLFDTDTLSAYSTRINEMHSKALTDYVSNAESLSNAINRLKYNDILAFRQAFSNDPFLQAWFTSAPSEALRFYLTEQSEAMAKLRENKDSFALLQETASTNQVARLAVGEANRQAIAAREAAYMRGDEQQATVMNDFLHKLAMGERAELPPGLFPFKPYVETAAGAAVNPTHSDKQRQAAANTLAGVALEQLSIGRDRKKVQSVWRDSKVRSAFNTWPQQKVEYVAGFEGQVETELNDTLSWDGVHGWGAYAKHIRFVNGEWVLAVNPLEKQGVSDKFAVASRQLSWTIDLLNKEEEMAAHMGISEQENNARRQRHMATIQRHQKEYNDLKEGVGEFASNVVAGAGEVSPFPGSFLGNDPRVIARRFEAIGKEATTDEERQANFQRVLEEYAGVKDISNIPPPSE